MIAANIMDIEVTALALEDSLVRASEVFAANNATELPVLDLEAVIIGVLSKERLLRAMQKGSDAAEVKAKSLNIAHLCEKAFKTTLPGAGLRELRKMLKGGEGKGGNVFIVDNAGRLLGRVGEVELVRRAAEYKELGERS